MITRVYIICPGCDRPTMLRIGVAVPPGERQPISVRCPQCASAIRGQLLTTEDFRVSVQLDEARIVPETASEDWQVITTHPAFPFVPTAETSPFIDIVGALGDAYEVYFEGVGQFNGLAAGDWRQLERAFQFYFAEDWDRFDTAMSRLMEDAWPSEPTTLARHDLIHRLLSVMLFPLDPMGGYPNSKKEIWQRAQPSSELIDFIREPPAQAELVALQKRLFRQLSHLVEIRHMWTPALPLLWINRLGRKVPEDWRLPGEDFVVMRHAYQQNFELSCQALPMLLVAQNAAEGRLATVIWRDGESSPWIPANLPANSNPPRTLAQFKKMNAEAKVAFLDRFPTTQAAWHEAFDRSIRNAIAHADADLVVATGEIRTGKGATLSYLAFVESVAKQVQLLLLWLDLAKLFRVYGSLAGQEDAK